MKAIPTQVWPGITSNGNSIAIPLTNLPGLTAAESDPATGNASSVIHALIESMYAAYNQMSAAEKPTKLRISKQPLRAIGENQFTQPYNISVDVKVPQASLDVIEEPAS